MLFIKTLLPKSSEDAQRLSTTLAPWGMSLPDYDSRGQMRCGSVLQTYEWRRLVKHPSCSLEPSTAPEVYKLCLNLSWFDGSFPDITLALPKANILVRRSQTPLLIPIQAVGGRRDGP